MVVDKETGEIAGEIVGARPITDTLRMIGGGMYLDTVSEKMAELVAAVNATGKKGKIALSITVKKATRGGAMHITGEVKITPPAEEAMEAILFATKEGNLVLDDPAQQKLDLRRVPDAVDVDETNLRRV